MINLQSLIKILKKNKSDFYTGVPDSILKELSKYLKNKSSKKHILATNEGSAVSIGIGYYLSTGKIPVIYMQNSGLSNAINPLISIANKNVYSIPLILIIGWRGSPKLKDEPQHVEKGKITKDILKLLNIKFIVVRNNDDLKKFDYKIKYAKKNNNIIACLIEQGTIKQTSKNSNKDLFKFNKEVFFKNLLIKLNNEYRIISSTGFNSRELMYVRKKYNIKGGNDFYVVGGMGHASSVSLGYALNNRNKTICIDGDGSFLMHLGSIKTLGTFANSNLKYILINNGTHDSVGGQSTFSNLMDIKSFSKSVGFKKYFKITNKINFEKKIKNFLESKQLSFLEVQVSNTKIKNLPRPKNLKTIKKLFMD